MGVDVFFVISGFLITGLLARGVARTGRVNLLEFYGRRARRLMPASALVLAVTWLVSRVVLPVTQLPAAAEQVRASALYVQNIVLARDAVDYLKAERQASPVQHFWSGRWPRLPWPGYPSCLPASGCPIGRSRPSTSTPNTRGRPAS
ncbi:acyltransferase family protein [uncultured Jatrophihabitans sp.]|uniref:acyltransferase family protein n=1 Tax=uncultured Jatrophihabitans sp. TaxID=1610747 RepID=UPI0035CC1BE5